MVVAVGHPTLPILVRVVDPVDPMLVVVMVEIRPVSMVGRILAAVVVVVDLVEQMLLLGEFRGVPELL